MFQENFDIVYASDIYVQGGTNAALASHIEYLAKQGYSVGILPMHLPHAVGIWPIYTKIRTVVTNGLARVIEPQTTRVQCDLFLIDNPSLMHTPSEEMPTVTLEARERIIIVPFPPRDGR